MREYKVWFKACTAPDKCKIGIRTIPSATGPEDAERQFNEWAETTTMFDDDVTLHFWRVKTSVDKTGPKIQNVKRY
jgi:hypothetical protein